MYSLISHATSHLARRGVHDLKEGFPEDPQGQLELILKEIPGWGALIIIFTVLGYFLAALSVDYTLSVIFKLASVENYQHAFAIPTMQSGAPPAYKDTDPLTGEVEAEADDPEVLLVQPRPITAGIRTTIRHLVSIGGPTARWRGLSMFIVYSICLTFLSGILGFLTPFVSGILSRIILSRWEMGWTHIVISSPSSKPWYQRMPPLKTWKKIWGPTALAALAIQVALLVPTALFFALQMHDVERLRDEPSGADPLKLLLIVFAFLVAYFFIVVPAEVALTRVQASLLSEEESAVVPFDRTFGERVVPETEGGSGKLSFRDAWRSINKEARWRIIKLVIKTILINIAVHLFFFIFIVAEAALILLPALRRARSGDAPSDDMKLV